MKERNLLARPMNLPDIDNILNMHVSNNSYY